MDYSLKTEELWHILSMNTKIQKDEIEICPVDLLPKKINTKRIFVINSDVATGKGKHWVSIFFPSNSLPEFFDSLGKCPSTYSHFLLNFLIENSPKGFIYNYTRLQNLQTSTCGLYCIYFLEYRLNGIYFEDILKKFSRNLQNNELKVIQFYKYILTK